MRRRIVCAQFRFPSRVHRSAFIACFLAFLFSLSICVALGNAQEEPKPKLQKWQIDGILAALDDAYPEVKQRAFEKLREFDAAALKSFPKQSEEIGKRAIDIFTNSQEGSSLRSNAAGALGNIGKTDNGVIQLLVNVLKNSQENLDVRRGAAEALGTIGKTNDNAVQVLVNILKNSKEDSSLRNRAAEALGNIGKTNDIVVEVFTNILKNSQEDRDIRSRAAYILGAIGKANANSVQVLTKVLKNIKEDQDVRSNAAYAMGKIGKASRSARQVLTYVVKNCKKESNLCLSAAEALGDVGKIDDSAIQVLTHILKNTKEESFLPIRAASILGDIGKINNDAVQVLADSLQSTKGYSFTHSNVLDALGTAGKINNNAVQVLINFLKDNQEDSYIRSKALEALGTAGKTNNNAVQVLINFLKDNQEDYDVRRGAAEALGNIGKTNDNAVQVLVNILKNTKEDSSLRNRAAEALGNIGKTNDNAVQVLVNILKNTKEDSSLRNRATEALGNIGKTNDNAVQVLVNILKNTKEDRDVRRTAVEALRKSNKADPSVIHVLVNLVKDSKAGFDIRRTAAEGLEIKKLDFNQTLSILDFTYLNSESDYAQWRFLNYWISGGDEDFRILMKWLGKAKEIPKNIERPEGKKVLQIFIKTWNSSDNLPSLREDLARKIVLVAQKGKGKWQNSDYDILNSHYENLKTYYQSDAAGVKDAIDSLTFRKYFNQFREIAAAHLAFWVALIFAYPKFPQVQAIFFWNPWVRKIGGAGYVGFLLAWVPFLRRKLFEPFRDSLLADAKLHSFNPDAYFPDSEVTLKGTDQPQPIQIVFPEIKGQSILEGDSGLGKTLFLRHLVKASQRIVVYLPAEKCEKGVIEAIQAKLHGQAQDADFLRNLIYSGAIDICIDGLNEVSADTRATISDFVERYFKGNILMTTQPLEWSPPSTAKTYVLQPLRPDQIQTFLISRQTVMPVCATYATDCDRYLQSALSPNQSPEERTAAQRILSNPMDLSIVAQMLAQGRTPDLFRLQEQQYTLMANEYRQIYSSEFPLKPFSEAVYQRRLNDEPALPAEEFYNELICMEDDKHKMVISRQWKDTKGEIQKEWYFRHDKIAEFFIVQTFLGDSETAQTRMYEHLGDPRFRGVYFLLATFLSIDAAQDLRETLIQYAADTKDHTVSDTFVQLLRTRKA